MKNYKTTMVYINGGTTEVTKYNPAKLLKAFKKNKKFFTIDTNNTCLVVSLDKVIHIFVEEMEEEKKVEEVEEKPEVPRKTLDELFIELQKIKKVEEIKKMPKLPMYRGLFQSLDALTRIYANEDDWVVVEISKNAFKKYKYKNGKWSDDPKLFGI